MSLSNAILHLGRFHFTPGNSPPNNQTTKQLTTSNLSFRPPNGSTAFQSSHDFVRSFFSLPAFLFPNDIYFSFQIPQVESNRSIAHVWSSLRLNRCATDRYLRERQTSPYRSCNWQRNLQICNGITHSTICHPTTTLTTYSSS